MLSRQSVPHVPTSVILSAGDSAIGRQSPQGPDTADFLPPRPELPGTVLGTALEAAAGGQAVPARPGSSGLGRLALWVPVQTVCGRASQSGA